MAIIAKNTAQVIIPEWIFKNDINKKFNDIMNKPISVKTSAPILSARAPQNAERIAMIIGEIIMRSPALEREILSVS